MVTYWVYNELVREIKREGAVIMATSEIFNNKIEILRSLIETQATKEMVEGLLKANTVLSVDTVNSITSKTCPCYAKPGRKYTKIDIGGSGRYMVDNETGDIFGIKAYGVVHLGYHFGNLDTIFDWYWGGYRAHKISKTLFNT